MEREKENFRVIEYDRAFNYSAINNYAVSRSDSDILILLNDDVEIISENWMMEMVQHALRSDIGAVGAKLYYDNGTIQHAGVVLGIGGVAGHGHKYFPRKAHGYFSRLKLIQNCSAVTGACMAVRRELYEEIGGLDEENLPIAFNDVDFCLRLREAGYRNLWTPYAEAYHHESASRGVDNTPAKLRRFASEIEYMKRRWGDILTNDPYYSRHLTLEHEDFSIDVR
jgi:GT2 family glycosyltransferase